MNNTWKNNNTLSKLREDKTSEIEKACRDLETHLWKIGEYDYEYRAKDIVVKYQNGEIYIGYLSQEANNEELFDYLKQDEKIRNLKKFGKSILLEVGNRGGDDNIIDHIFIKKKKQQILEELKSSVDDLAKKYGFHTEICDNFGWRDIEGRPVSGYKIYGQDGGLISELYTSSYPWETIDEDVIRNKKNLEKFFTTMASDH